MLAFDHAFQIIAFLIFSANEFAQVLLTGMNIIGIIFYLNTSEFFCHFEVGGQTS